MNYRTLLSEVLLYVRSTQLVTDIRIQLGLRRSAILVIALVFAAIALVFLNIAAYIALVLVIGSIWTPLLLAFINLILMLICLFMASSLRSSVELDAARDVQSSSLAHLNEELTSPRPLYGFLDPEIMAELVPVIASIVRAVRKRGRSKTAPSE